ncbi:hypothetical protein UA08_03671 [Talaromyces atroroseus]|uniref:Major facilitator superfamily (MFS) profile domain-containing protein n=1 Tax=Talaromyces atroroseus TaxID=1441469 RepID=A0A225AZ54_TALAT|nr:hypothetical protein UA08_03671 [Talaromyces atroroseus]OKL60999.1 hypothetical protein UA08_03671 [Talaromyces atroroseus]
MGRHDAAEKSLQDQRNILPIGQLVIVFSGLAISLLICFIDQNGLSVALPSISKDLNAEDTISWAGTSSLIANAVCTVLYGRLSDIFGRKSVYISVLILLSVADLLCGLAVDPPMLYVFRAMAGIATGGITNMTMIIVSDVVTLQDRGKYQGILGSCVGLGNVIGPFIAAAFVERDSWRDIFYLLCPCAAVSAVVAWFLLPSKMRPESMKSQVKKIDFMGTITSTIAIVFILIPISGGGLYFRWDSALVIFSIFKRPVATTLLLQSFLLGAAYQSLLYYLPLYVQNARGWSPIQSAICSLPMVCFQSTLSILSGQYMSRLNRYHEVIFTGFALWCLGIGLTLLWDGSTPKSQLYGTLVLVGAGIGCTFQPTLVALQAHTPTSQRAVVISIRNFFRCTGGAVGLAISAAILQSVLKANLPAGYEYLTRTTYALPDQGSIPAADWDAIVQAYIKASHTVFIFQVPLVGACVLGCFFIRDKGLQKQEDSSKNNNKEGVKKEQGQGQVQTDATESQATTQIDTDIESGNNAETRDRDVEKQIGREDGKKADKADEASIA